MMAKNWFAETRELGLTPFYVLLAALIIFSGGALTFFGYAYLHRWWT